MHKHYVSLPCNQWQLFDFGHISCWKTRWFRHRKRQSTRNPSCPPARPAFVSGTQGGLTLDPATCASCVASCALTLERVAGCIGNLITGNSRCHAGYLMDFKIQTSCKFRCVWRWQQICYGVWYLKNELLVVVNLHVKCAYPQLYSWIISIPRSWSSTHEWQHTNASISWQRSIGVMSRFSTPASILLDLQVIRASDCKTWSHC